MTSYWPRQEKIMQMNHSDMNRMQDISLHLWSPPSSPLTLSRLTIKMPIPTKEQLRYKTTERSKPEAGTSQGLPSAITAMTHGRPRPRKTLTELEPVTLPTAASAKLLSLAAVILAKVSGSEVPIATKVMAVTPGLRPMTQPITPAISPTIAVNAPMKQIAAIKHGMPPPQWGGGQQENRSFQPIEKK